MRAPSGAIGTDHFYGDADFVDATRPWVPVEITLRNENAREMEVKREDVLLTLEALGDKVRMMATGNDEPDIVRTLVRNGSVDLVRNALRREHKDRLATGRCFGIRPHHYELNHGSSR